MASLLLTLNGWVINTHGTAAQQYNNDSGIWSNISSDNEDVGSSIGSTATCHKGGWDGNRWYIISATGGVHAYTPTTNSWVGPLVSGSVILTGTPSNDNWCMTSDGSYVYILSDSNDFRRYDPSLDTITTLATPPGAVYFRTMFLTYDGSGNIYGSKGGNNPATIAKYNIASNLWTSVSSGGWSGGLGAGNGSWTAMLSGMLFLVFSDSGNTLKSYRYLPNSDTWITGSTVAATTIRAANPGGEDSDSSIRIWEQNNSMGSWVYNIVTDTWSLGASAPTSFAIGGTNFVVTRSFSAAFTWYQSDGTTQLPITLVLGSATLGQTLTFHAKVKTPVARAAGVTVSVPINITTDAEDVVTISNLVGGPFTTSFSTGALNAGDEFDVFIQVIPTAQQTLGLSKRFFLEVASN